MKKLSLLIILSLICVTKIFAQPTTDSHSFGGSVVNKTGHVIRFMLGNSGYWVGITSGTSAFLFWDTYPSTKVEIEGLPTLGKYQSICKDITNLYAGQTIIVNIRDRADEASDFYCSIEPAVH